MTPSNPEPENEQPSTEQLVPERTHTVREGDSLWDIALEYDVTVDQLLQLNPEVSKSMLVGQTLIISQASDSSDSQESSSSPAEDAPAEEAPSEEESPAEEETASAEESSSSRTHTVQDGDSLWDIATQYDVSVEQLQQLNPEVSKSMLVGETLMIPPADSSDAADKQTTSDSVSAEAEKSSETSTASTEQPEQIQTEKAAEEPLSANNEIISFVQSIRVERGLYPVSSVESLQSINVKLDSVVEGEQTYTIQQGDSPSLVADKVGIPTQTLMEHTHIAKDGTVYTHTHEEVHEHGHSHSHPHHHENTKAVLNRMNRAIGHMEAVKTMIEDGRDCSEVLIQIAAVRSAINNIGKIILEDHINHCLVDAIETGDEQVLKDLNEAINKFVK